MVRGAAPNLLPDPVDSTARPIHMMLDLRGDGFGTQDRGCTVSPVTPWLIQACWVSPVARGDAGAHPADAAIAVRLVFVAASADGAAIEDEHE